MTFVNNADFSDVMAWLTLALHFCLALGATAHILFFKHEVKTSAAWLALVWLSPFLGVSLYYILGINRIYRRASALMSNDGHAIRFISDDLTKREGQETLPQMSEALERFRIFGFKITANPLLGGNRIEILCNGEQTYPAMLEAISKAQQCIGLCSYIFDRGQVAQQFYQALSDAQKRGVEVRVLIDFVGAHYSIPTSLRQLQRLKIRSKLFLPTLWPWQLGVTNLRNHRKLLFVDSQVAFTGGLNIRDRHDSRYIKDRALVEDVHFEVRGPVVDELKRIFAEDWYFAAKENLFRRPWFERLEQTLSGNSFCRVVSDGPDLDFEKIKWLLLGAISTARKKIRIVTPYFVPDQEVQTALRLAALSGVEIEIMIPMHNNVPLVHWAAMATLGDLLGSGCRVYLKGHHFDHSKFMIMDDYWCFIGSSNWDARSLRLNFELNLEVIDQNLNHQLNQLFDRKIQESREMSLEMWNRRHLAARLRDNAARLLSPYL